MSNLDEQSNAGGKSVGDNESKARATISLEELMEMADEGEGVTACGCTVEPDGTCPHGKPSLMLEYGLI